MKKNLLLFIFFLLFIFNVKGQNLVPNGDFEQYSSCPISVGQLDLTLFWINPTNGSPDYYHSCCTSSFASVPNNFTGYQMAHSDSGYSGILLFEGIGQNYREYIEMPLISTLINNTCYYFEMYINLAEIGRYTTDDLGIYFSDTLIAGINNYDPLPFIPQINNSVLNMPDTAIWMLVSGNYSATGNENYLIIGNFKNDLSTNANLYNSQSLYPAAYIYIDDVSLTPCTAIQEQNKNEAIKIYPNPVKEELFVNCHSLPGKKEIIISDILGKEIYSDQFMTSDFRLPASGFQSGIYFVEIIPIESGRKNILRKKFLKE